MTILLPTLAATFAALYVWLTMRIVNRRERWAKWTLAGVVGVPMLYVLSFGPACWLAVHQKWIRGTVNSVYSPVAWARLKVVPDSVGRAIDWYASVGGIVLFYGTDSGGFQMEFDNDISGFGSHPISDRDPRYEKRPPDPP